MDYSIIAVGIRPANIGADDAVVEAGEKLRRLVENAIAAKPHELGEDLVVSMGPKLSVMLGYPGADNLDKVLSFAKSLQMALADQSGLGFFVAGAITVGATSPVPVFDQGWNFEGRAGIAAARILAKLEPGQLVLERGACLSNLRSQLSDEYNIPGKHTNETFAVRLHKRIKFPSPLGAPTTVAPTASGAPVTPTMAKHPKSTDTVTQLRADARIVSKTIKSSAIYNFHWRQIEVEARHDAIPDSLLIRERHELEGVKKGEPIVLPLAVCLPRDYRGDAKLNLLDEPIVFDLNGPVAVARANLSKQSDHRIRLWVPTWEKAQSSKRVVLEVFYRPEPVSDRICIRLPIEKGQRLDRARITLWGPRKQLERQVAAFSIGTGSKDRGRHPLIGQCSELDGHEDGSLSARVWGIDDFRPGYEHEISWPVSDAPGSPPAANVA